MTKQVVSNPSEAQAFARLNTDAADYGVQHGEAERVKKRAKPFRKSQITPAKVAAAKREAKSRIKVTLPSRTSGLPMAVMLPVDQRGVIKRPERQDVFQATPIVADRVTPVQLRDEVARLTKSIDLIAGELLAMGRNPRPDKKDRIIHKSLILAQRYGKRDWCLNELIRLGALETQAEATGPRLIPAYSDSFDDLPDTQGLPANTIAAPGRAKGLSNKSQNPSSGKAGRGGTTKTVTLPFPKAGLLPPEPKAKR